MLDDQFVHAALLRIHARRRRRRLYQGLLVFVVMFFLVSKSLTSGSW